MPADVEVFKPESLFQFVLGSLYPPLNLHNPLLLFYPLSAHHPLLVTVQLRKKRGLETAFNVHGHKAEEGCLSHISLIGQRTTAM